MDTQAIVLDVDKYTKVHFERYLEELREICAIDSNSYHKLGLDKMATYIAARMNSLKMEVKLMNNEKWGNDVQGVLKGNGEGNILILGHMDTVYPTGTAAIHSLKIEGDIIYGPGVCDMKGGILSAIYAIEALLSMGYDDFGEIRFLCVSDEEILERHSKDTIQKVCQNCHGALVLEAARINGDIVSARKGTAWYTLSAHGCSAHAGVDFEKGRNAIVELAHQILQFQSLNGWRDGITINPGFITGGTTLNVVPAYAQAGFDLRFLYTHDKNDIETLWFEMLRQQRVQGVELALETMPEFREPMICTPESLKLIDFAQEISNLLGFSVNHVHTGGSSDASYPSSLGIPTIDGLGPIGGQDHSPDEYIIASSVAPRTALLAGLITGVGKMK